VPKMPYWGCGELVSSIIEITTEVTMTILTDRKEVLNSISITAAEHIMTRCVEEAPSVEDAVKLAHDVIRHLVSKLNVEVK